MDLPEGWEPDDDWPLRDRLDTMLERMVDLYVAKRQRTITGAQYLSERTKLLHETHQHIRDHFVPRHGKDEDDE
jgi:hypothetical protein